MQQANIAYQAPLSAPLPAAGENAGPMARPAPHDLILGSYNLHKAVGRDMRRDPERTIEVIREIGADIVALQEVDRRFGDRKGVLDLDALHAATGLEPVPFADKLGRLAHGWHGNLLLFRNAAPKWSACCPSPCRGWSRAARWWPICAWRATRCG